MGKLLYVFFLTAVCTSPMANKAQAALSYTEAYTTSGSSQGKSKVVILIKKSLYDVISTSLQTYYGDLENENYHVTLTTIKSSNPTVEDVKDYLKGYYNSHNLKGAILIGDIPYATTKKWKDKFPTDIYLMNFSSQWSKDNNGTFSLNDSESSGLPEIQIWIGRIVVHNLNLYKNTSESKIIQKYLKRNHSFRTGQDNEVAKQALSYVIYEFAETEMLDATAKLGNIYTDFSIVPKKTKNNNTEYDFTTSGSYNDFKNRLEQQNYQWLHLVTHGWHTLHKLPSSPTQMAMLSQLTNDQVKQLNPRIRFYTFNSCGGANYSAKNYLEGYYVFGDYGLAALGFTTYNSADSDITDEIYDQLASGISLGESFKNFLNNDVSYPNPKWELNYLGAVILGDPTLKPK